MLLKLQGLLGLLAFIGFSWLMSSNRRQVKLKAILGGIAVQFLLALLVFKVDFVKRIFLVLNDAVLVLDKATHAGTAFVFGYVGGGDAPFTLTNPASAFVLAFQALPILLVVGAISSLLFYWRILPLIIKLMSFLLEKTLNLGGALGLGAASSMFLSMDAAPMLVKPYLKHFSQSELFVLMSCCMATVAASVMVVYAKILAPLMPQGGVIGHILAASMINVPGAITIARIMMPDTQGPTHGDFRLENEPKSVMDAITHGTSDGLKVLLGIVSMLVVLVALISIVNDILALLPAVHGQPLTLQHILGYIMAPVVWLMGVPWSEAIASGSLMGTRTALNEIIAYAELVRLPAGTLSPRTQMMMIYALCSFANFGSMGIMIGTFGPLAPERRAEVTSLVVKTILSGTLATCMTGTIVGLMY